MADILRPRHFNALWTPLGANPVPNSERTHAKLLELQRNHLARNPAAHPPKLMRGARDAFVGNGAWRIHCLCGEATHADPESKKAVCFGCGAIWDVRFPAERLEIEAALVKRRVQHTRNWQAPETVDDLIAENKARGPEFGVEE